MKGFIVKKKGSFIRQIAWNEPLEVMAGIRLNELF